MVVFLVKVHRLPTSNAWGDSDALLKMPAMTEPRMGPEHWWLAGIAPCRKRRECCAISDDFEVEDGINVPGG